MGETKRMRADDEFCRITARAQSPTAKRTEEMLDLWRRMQQGDTKALMKLSFMRGMITAEAYEDYQRIEKEYGR